jgi:inner membrane protein
MAVYLHFAPALALAVAAGSKTISWRLALVGALCAVLPDIDLALYYLHFDAYGGTYGHRGFTHSLGFALLLGALAAMGTGPGWRERSTSALFIVLCTASHPLLDGLMDRGICNAWLWPLDGARQCLPWRPIPLQGIPLFGSSRLKLELQWIGVPLLLLANAGMALRWSWRNYRGRVVRSSMRKLSRQRPVDPVRSLGPAQWRAMGVL